MRFTVAMALRCNTATEGQVIDFDYEEHCLPTPLGGHLPKQSYGNSYARSRL
jgi:hypothetical protein